MNIQEPLNVFKAELQDIYSAETQIVEALPKMIKAANDSELQAGFEEHLDETKEQVKRIEEIGELLGIKVEGKTCEGMKGLLKEGEEATKMTGNEMLLDSVLITGARKVEHYEILAYKSLMTLSQKMDEKDVELLLQKTLREEEQTDKKLEALSEALE